MNMTLEQFREKLKKIKPFISSNTHYFQKVGWGSNDLDVYNRLMQAKKDEIAKEYLYDCNAVWKMIKKERMENE